MKRDIKVRFMWKEFRKLQLDRLRHRQRILGLRKMPCYVFRKSVKGAFVRGWFWSAQVEHSYFPYPSKDEAVAGAVGLVMQGHATKIIRRKSPHG